MQAVILAAGRSTRTLPLTSTRPKPLIPIWGRPLLELQLDQLHGLVGEALLVVGYREEQIRAHFGDSYRGIRIRYVRQERQRGTADALLAARPYVRGRALVVNGDDFYHHDDLERLLDGGRGLLVTHAPDPQNRAVVTLDGDRIVSIVEKPKAPPPDALSSVGGYCIEREDLVLLDRLSPSPRGELELPDFITGLVQTSAVRAREIVELWIPLTYAWDVLTVMSVLWDEPARAIELGLAERPGNVAIAGSGPIWLGDGVVVAPDARLTGPIALGSGTRVDAGAVLERVVAFDGVSVGARAHIADSVLGAGVDVGPDARLESRAGHQLSIDIKGTRVVPALARLGAILGDGASIEAFGTVAPGTLVPAGESA